MKIQTIRKLPFWRKAILTLLFSCSTFAQVSGQSASSSLDSESDLFAKEELNRYFNDVPSAWKGHRDFADWLVKYLKPNQIVDLGVDFGFSTFVFANAARENGFGKVTGVDLFQGDGFTGQRNTHDCILDWVEQFGFKNIEIIKGDFAEVSSTWTTPVDILHIDGYHSYEAVSSDYHHWAPFVHDKGIVLFHDINVPNPNFGVIYFFRELTDGQKLYFLQSYGLGIITKNQELCEAIKKKFSNVYDNAKQPI